jgi:hypothetical protein
MTVGILTAEVSRRMPTRRGRLVTSARPSRRRASTSRCRQGCTVQNCTPMQKCTPPRAEATMTPGRGEWPRTLLGSPPSCLDGSFRLRAYPRDRRQMLLHMVHTLQKCTPTCEPAAGRTSTRSGGSQTCWYTLQLQRRARAPLRAAIAHAPPLAVGRQMRLFEPCSSSTGCSSSAHPGDAEHSSASCVRTRKPRVRGAWIWRMGTPATPAHATAARADSWMSSCAWRARYCRVGACSSDGRRPSTTGRPSYSTQRRRGALPRASLSASVAREAPPPEASPRLAQWTLAFGSLVEGPPPLALRTVVVACSLWALALACSSERARGKRHFGSRTWALAFASPPSRHLQRCACSRALYLLSRHPRRLLGPAKLALVRQPMAPPAPLASPRRRRP